MTMMLQTARAVAQAPDSTPLRGPAAVFIVVGVVFFLIFLGVIITFFRTWIRAQALGVPVSFGALIGMRLRKVPAGPIVDARIAMHQAGVDDVSYEDLERLHLAGGNMTKVAQALVAARAANIELTFEHAAAIDLAGRDVVAEVRQAAEGAPAPGA